MTTTYSMATLRFAVLGLVAALSLGNAPTAVAQPAAHDLFGSKPGPSAHLSEPFGTYNKGCLAGGVELEETGPYWQAMRLNRNRNWGHDVTVQFIKDLAKKTVDLGWARLLVGDIGQPRGGPMRTGHRSHQMGLDVDIWLRKPREKLYTRAEREQIGSTLVVASNRVDLNRSWTPTHHQIIKTAAKDRRVARIFVNAAIKRRMCRDEPGGDRGWLRKIRPWKGHDYHFHVRLNCPPDSPGCAGQAAPPGGDGCGGVLDWWFTAEGLGVKKDATRALKINPDGTGKPRPKYITMGDLPTACRIVLDSE